MSEYKKSRRIRELHDRAENRIASELGKIPEPLSANIQEIIHELQIQRIELELQNEDLRRIQIELQESRDLYRHLFEFSPIGYFTIREDDSILEVNQTGSELLGLSQAYLLKNKFTQFIMPESQDTFHFHRRNAFATGNRQTSDLQMRRKDGTSFYVHLESLAIGDEKGNVSQIRIAVTDITEHKQALDALAQSKSELEARVAERTAELTEANANLKLEVQIRSQIEDELRRSERFNASLLENAPNPILANSADGTIAFVNKAFEKLTGFSSREVVGQKPPYPWWPIEKVSEYLPRFAKFYKKGFNHYQRLLRKKNGEPFWIEATTTYLKDTSGEIINRIVIWEDITRRKKAEDQLAAYQEELRTLASQLTLSEEAERRNIAGLIHDGVTQLLALCVMKIETLRNSVPDSKLSASLNEIYKITQQAIEDTRTLTFELSPPSLYDLGMEAALEELTERFSEKLGISASYEDDGQPKPLEESTSVLLFQSVRELLHNVEKHARAQHVEIHTRRVSDTIRITVRDDGIGFTPRSLRSRRKDTLKLGLFSIRERFRHIGGKILIKSRPGKGSLFTLIAPLKVEKE